MALPTITIANMGGTTNSLSQVISGSTDGVAAGSAVVLDDNGSPTPLGTATVAADGSWSSDVVLLYGANAIVASVADPDGGAESSAAVDVWLEPILSPPSNGLAPGLPLPGPVPVPVQPEHVRHADHPHSTFVFGVAPGQTLITGFEAAGPGHDALDLPRSEFVSVANALRDLHEAGHDAVLTISPGNSITIQDVTAAMLRAHPHDIWLHG